MSKIILATDQVLKVSGYSAEEITDISFPQLFKVRASLRELYEFYFKNESSVGEWPHGFLVGKNGETMFYQFSMLKLMRGDKFMYLLSMKHQEDRLAIKFAAAVLGCFFERYQFRCFID